MLKCESCKNFSGECTLTSAGKDYCLNGNFDLYEEDTERLKAQTETAVAQEIEETVEDALGFKEDFKGFNGKLEGVAQADSCDGCKNHSQLSGCFLNKFTECVSKNRFLYELDTVEGLEAKTELEEELEKSHEVAGELSEIDSLLDNL